MARTIRRRGRMQKSSRRKTFPRLTHPGRAFARKTGDVSNPLRNSIRACAAHDPGGRGGCAANFLSRKNPQAMKIRSQIHAAATLGVAVLNFAVGHAPARASSHMDAPLITLDHAANTTDVYAFVVVRNNQKFLDVGLAVYPHQEPGVGPNKYNFDPNVLYQIFLADPVTGADRVAYQFQFADNYKTQATILQSSTVAVEANGDAAQHLTQS